MTSQLLNTVYQARLDILKGLTALLIIVFMPVFTFAEINDLPPATLDCSVPINTQAIRPDPEGTKTKVKMGFFIVDIKDISDVEQTYTADIVFNFAWNDPRLSVKSLGRSLERCYVNLDDVWHPPIMEVNRSKGEKLLPQKVTVDSEGNVNYKQRYIGELSSDLEFTDFPFDSQVLHFILAAYGPDAEHLVLKQDKDLSGARAHFSIEGWKIGLLDAVTKSEVIKSEGAARDRNFARIDFRLSAERDRQYYLLNVITPLCLIVLMAWAVFWIDPSAIGPQIGLSTATVFTLIAYRFSLSYQLPKVSYFTRVDKFVLFSTILVFVALGTAIATSKIASDGNKSRANIIENWARYIYLFLFALILIFTLWL